MKQRAVRMYAEMRPDQATDWAAMARVAELLGISGRGDGPQVGAAGRDRSGRSTRHDERGVGGVEAVEAGERGTETGERDPESSLGFLRGRARPARAVIVDFIREHADHTPAEGGLRWGVEPICAVLSEHGVKIAPSTYYEWRDKLPTQRQERDTVLVEHIRRVHADNYGVYGPRKVWLALNREGIPVARCTVERLMKTVGLAGVVRGKVKRTTIAGTGPRPDDLVKRNFEPLAPNRLWVADFTYVSTWAGWVFVAFVIDAYARRILGWRTATAMTAELVLDAIEQAIWTRQQQGHDQFDNLVAHNDRGVQYLSVAYSQRLADAGITPSVGAVGSSYDNALAESINGLYKTEVIRRQGPWHNVDAAEIATAQWVDWYNHRRLNQHAGDMPPAVLEQVHYAQQQPSAAS